MEKKAVPEVVSLVALGASKRDFFTEAMTVGNRKGVSDEVWVVNKMGCLVKHDMLWRMDDLMNVYACNNKVYTGGNVKEPVTIHDTYTEFLKNHNKPIVTSTAYPDEFPTSVQYPLEDVINTIGYSYFRTTPAYAAAFAIHIGVKRLRIFGCDYVYPTNKHRAEAGRANLEFILGIGMTMGMEVWVPPSSSLLDSCIPTMERMYGYIDPIEVKPSPEDDNLWKVYRRPDLRTKELEKQQRAEEKELQRLMTKYANIVKHDLIDGKYITKDDIDKHFLDASERTVKEPLTGE
jgi:hypothetical protein